MTRWLVTGARGMLGLDLVTTAAGRGHEVAGPDRAELDITDAAAVRQALAHRHRRQPAKRQRTHSVRISAVAL